MSNVKYFKRWWKYRILREHTQQLKQTSATGSWESTRQVTGQAWLTPARLSLTQASPSDHITLFLWFKMPKEGPVIQCSGESHSMQHWHPTWAPLKSWLCHFWSSCMLKCKSSRWWPRYWIPTATQWYWRISWLLVSNWPNSGQCSY